MADFMVDGQPFERPIGAASEGYAMTPPSIESGLGAFFRAGSPLGYLNRTHDRAIAADPRQGELEAYAAAGIQPDTATWERLQATPAPPNMQPEDYNARYAPTGPDGKSVSLG